MCLGNGNPGAGRLITGGLPVVRVCGRPLPGATRRGLAADATGNRGPRVIAASAIDVQNN